MQHLEAAHYKLEGQSRGGGGGGVKGVIWEAGGGEAAAGALPATSGGGRRLLNVPSSLILVDLFVRKSGEHMCARRIA